MCEYRTTRCNDRTVFPWVWQSNITYYFDSLEFGTKPSVITELSLTYTSSCKIFRKATHSRNERCFAAFIHVRISARCIIWYAIPYRPRQQPAGPINGLHCTVRLKLLWRTSLLTKRRICMNRAVNSQAYRRHVLLFLLEVHVTLIKFINYSLYRTWHRPLCSRIPIHARRNEDRRDRDSNWNYLLVRCNPRKYLLVLQYF